MTDSFLVDFRAPSYTPQNTPQHNLVENQFGDGYKQRLEDGLNQLADNWNIPWNCLSNAEARTLIDFMNAHRVQPFLWTPPDELVAKKYICRNLTHNPTANAPGYTDVTVTLEQDFGI